MHTDIMLSCSCCGKGIRDNAEENVSFGKVPYPDDTGFGMCRECGGDDKADISTDEGWKKRIGWGLRMFYEARFDIVRKRLSEEARKKWDASSYRKKCLIIAEFVREGLMI